MNGFASVVLMMLILSPTFATRTSRVLLGTDIQAVLTTLTSLDVDVLGRGRLALAALGGARRAQDRHHRRQRRLPRRAGDQQGGRDGSLRLQDVFDEMLCEQRDVAEDGGKTQAIGKPLAGRQPVMYGGNFGAAVLIGERDRDRHLAAQQHLVADEHAHHVHVAVGEADRGLQLLLVLLAVVIDPGADRDVHVMALRHLRDAGERPLHAVGAHRLDLAGLHDAGTTAGGAPTGTVSSTNPSDFHGDVFLFSSEAGVISTSLMACRRPFQSAIFLASRKCHSS